MFTEKLEIEIFNMYFIKLYKRKENQISVSCNRRRNSKRSFFFYLKDGFEDSLLISFDITIEIIKAANINPDGDVVIDISDKMIKIYEDNNTEEKDLFFDIDKKINNIVK